MKLRNLFLLAIEIYCSCLLKLTIGCWSPEEGLSDDDNHSSSKRRPIQPEIIPEAISRIAERVLRSPGEMRLNNPSNQNTSLVKSNPSTSTANPSSKK